MFIRTTELDRLVRLVKSGNSVELVGHVGSGKTTLLEGCIASLERSGKNVLHIQGHQSLQQYGLEPLNLAGIEPPQQARPGLPMSQMIDALAQDLVTSSLILCVDDIDTLDDRSFAVLDVATRRSGVVVITSRTLPGIQPVDSHSKFRLGTNVARLPLEPLSLDMASELIHSLLNEPVDHASMGRMYARTGGNSALIAAMVKAGVNSGFLRLESAGWFAVGGLWNAELEPSIEHLFDRLGAEDVEALEILSLSTFMDLGIAIRLIGQEPLERLDTAGLVDIVPEGELLKVSVTPPVLSDYFMHKKSGVRRARLVSRLLEELPSTGHENLLREAAVTSTFDGSSLEGRSSMLLARLLRDRREIALATSRSAWQQAHTARAAVDYIDALFQYGTDSTREIEAVLKFASHTILESPWSAQLEIRRAQWKALYLEDLAGALEGLSSAADRSPGFAALFGAHSLRLEIGLVGVPNSVFERIEDLTSEGSDQNDWLNIAQVYALLVSGNWREAQVQFEALSLQHDAEREGFLKLMGGLLSYASGDLDGTLRQALSELADARNDLNLPLIWMMTYVAALCQMALGKYHECENTLNAAFAIGFAGADERCTQIACYNLGSILATRMGRLSTAISLANQGQWSQNELWSIPATLSDWPKAHLDLFDAGSEVANDRLRALIDNLQSRGLHWTALLTSVALCELVPSAEAFALARELSQEAGNSFTAAFLDLQEASFHENAEQILSAAEVMQQHGAIYHAATAYSLAVSLLRDAGKLDQTEAVEQRLLTMSEHLGVSLATLRARPPEHWQLTSRESQIAALAANGMRNQEIGERLSISVRTVENHLNRVYRKTGASSRSQLQRHGLG